MPINEIAGCIGCNTCVETCPTDVIQMDHSRNRATSPIPKIARSVTCADCIARSTRSVSPRINPFRLSSPGGK